MGIKEKLIINHFKRLYKINQTPTSVFTMEYCKSLVKQTVDELYKLFPDKNIGKLSINWFDSKGNKPEKINDSVQCFEICFHDRFDNMPWLICRFYKNDPKVRLFSLCN